MIFFKDKYFISCTTVNPYNEKDDPLEYKRFETYGDFHNFDIIYKKYKTWVLETKSNKMTTTKKLLTIKNNLEKDRKGILEFIIRSRLNIVLSNSKDIPSKYRYINKFLSYTVKSFHFYNENILLPLYNKDNYIYNEDYVTLQMFFCDTSINNLYSPKYNGDMMGFVEIEGKTLFNKITIRLFNNNYFGNKENLKKKFPNGKIEDLSNINHQNENYDINLLPQELKFYFNIDVRPIYTLTKDNIEFLGNSNSLINNNEE